VLFHGYQPYFDDYLIGVVFAKLSLLITYRWDQKAVVFVPDKPFLSSVE